MAVIKPQPVPVPEPINNQVPISQIDRAPDPLPAPPAAPPVPISQVDRAPNSIDVPVTSTAPPISAIDVAPDPVAGDPGVPLGANRAPVQTVTPAIETVANVANVAGGGGGGSRPMPIYISVDQNGNVVVQRTLVLNFLGAGVTVTASGSQANITIPGGGGGNADLGNWAFVANTMYNLNGGAITNGDLSHGATASLTLPANGDGNSVSLLNYYGAVNLTTGTGPGQTKNWTFGSTGTLTAPGAITATGNVTANYFIGDGSQLTNLPRGNGIPGGTNLQVQYNFGNTFAGHPNFTFDPDTDTLQVPANLIVDNIYSVDSSTVHVHDDLETFGAMTAVGYYLTDGGSWISVDANTTAFTAHANLQLVVDDGNTWIFGETGTLTLPYNTVIKDNSDGALAFGVGASLGGSSAISIGTFAAGNGDQGFNAVAIGGVAGQFTQGAQAIAVGGLAGNYNQGLAAIAIGSGAGQSGQGESAIAIGASAGDTNQPNNSIIINASGTSLNGTTAGLYIDPVRNDTGNTVNTVYYNTTTKELTYGPGSGGTYGDGNVVSLLSAFGSNTISTAGNVTADYFLGDGSQLTNLPVQPGTYGDSNVTALMSAFGSNTISTTGNVTAGNFIGSGANVELVAGGNTWTFDTTGNLTAPGALLPIANISQDVGSSTNRWRDIYLANSTIYLGDSAISANGNSMVTSSIEAGNLSIGTMPGLIQGDANTVINVVANGVNGGYLVNYYSDYSNANAQTGELALNSSSGNVTYQINLSNDTGNVGNTKSWIFDSTGNLSASGNLQLVSNSNLWKFDTNGALTLPGDTLQLGLIAGNTGLKNLNDANIIIDASGNTWTFGVDGNLTYPDGTVSIGGATYAAPSSSVQMISNNAYNQVRVDNANVEIYTSLNGIVLKEWLFDGSGTLTIPGNIAAGTNWINNLSNPVQPQDAATKQYVDNNAAGLNIHDPVLLATTQDLATYTGATVTYNNGTGGVGATLSFSGNTLTTLDGQSITGGSSTRLLVKNEANAVYNGVYTYTSNVLLTRATDMDQTSELTGGDYVFVQAGNTQASSSWVQQDAVGNVGVGNVTFVQFGASQSYSAGNALTLNGSAFNVNVDASTILINGGNQLKVGTVPAANVSGLATVATTGNYSDLNGAYGNANVEAYLSSYSGNILTTGNITGSYIIGNGSQLTGLPAGYTDSNVTTLLSSFGSNSISTTGNVTADYLFGNISQATGLTSSQVTTALGFTPGTGNGTVTNVQGNGTVSGLTLTGSVSTTGNLTLGGTLDLSSVSGNITTAGNISGGYILGNGSQLTGLPASYGNANVVTLLASYGSNSISTTGNITSGNITTGNLTVTGNISGNIVAPGSDTQIFFNDSGLANASANLTFNKTTSTLDVNGQFIAGTGTPVVGLTNPTISAASSANNYVQIDLFNANTGTQASSDFIAYPDNGTDASGWVDVGITSSTFNQAAYSVTGSNESYLFASAPSGAGKSGNLVFATDSTGSSNSIEFYVGGFNQAKNGTGRKLLLTSTAANVTGNLNVSANLAVNGGVISTTATTANVFNVTPTTVNIAGSATLATNIGNASGTVNLSGNVQGNTNGFAIGYRDIPQVSFSANATAALSDAGKHYYSTSSSNLTLTVPNNASAGFSVGSAINIVNQGTGTITIAQGSGVTMYFAGNSTSGNRTLSSYGVATLQKVATDTWFIVGVGIT